MGCNKCSLNMKFNRKIIPDTNHKTGFVSKKRFYEDEINFEELRSYRLNRIKKELEKKILKHVYYLIRLTFGMHWILQI